MLHWFIKLSYCCTTSSACSLSRSQSCIRLEIARRLLTVVPDDGDVVVVWNHVRFILDREEGVSAYSSSAARGSAARRGGACSLAQS